MAERDWAEALKVADHFRKGDKNTASYLAALVYLAQDDLARATPEVHVLEESFRSRKHDRQLQFRIWETRGLLLCQSGSADAGLKLLAKVADQTKNDYNHHAWGNGAYYMEVQGLAALRCGKLDIAEHALLEALAHDSGSVRAAMGMQVLCEKQNRHDEARRYSELARRFWKNAEVRSFDAEFAAIRSPLSNAAKAQKESTVAEVR